MIAEHKLDELMMAPSERRAEVLTRLCAESDVDEAREMLASHFNICDALAPWAADLREQFERVGYVSDTDETLDLPCVVYRAAWEDDDVDAALSWTTDLDVAKKFALMLTGPRAKFVLGLYRDDVVPVIFKGTCVRAFAYFQSRQEHEVVAAEVIDVEAIMKLVTVPA